jgi:hypothetical protein
MECHSQFDLQPDEPLRMAYGPQRSSMSKNSATVQLPVSLLSAVRSNSCVAKYARFRRSALKEAWFTTAQFASGNSAFIASTNSGHTTFSANQVTFRYFDCNRWIKMKNVATCSRSCAGFRRTFTLLPSWQGSPAFTCTHASAAGTAKPMSASSAPMFSARMSISFTTPLFGKNKQASLRMRSSQS